MDRGRFWATLSTSSRRASSCNSPFFSRAGEVRQTLSLAHFLLADAMRLIRNDPRETVTEGYSGLSYLLAADEDGFLHPLMVCGDLVRTNGKVCYLRTLTGTPALVTHRGVVWLPIEGWTLLFDPSELELKHLLPTDGLDLVGAALSGEDMGLAHAIA